MKRFIVVSYCADQDQVFHDVVEAPSEARAKALAVKVRGDYAVITDVLTDDFLLDLLTLYICPSSGGIINKGNWEELREEWA